MLRKPLIAIPADRRLVGKHHFHMVGEKYIRAVAEGADAVPVLIPAFGMDTGLQDLLDQFDGILLTGSPSNVEPHRYGGPASAPGTLHDPDRDATTLSLIPLAVAAGIPVLAICRGFQEMNVAYGGTLWQRVHEIEGHLDHREDESQPLDRQYGPAHEVLLEPGGVLRNISGGEKLTVNSLHSQGVDRLGQGLMVEARAPDGLVEAFSDPAAPGFALGVQWHPEWQFEKNAFSRALFGALGKASRQYAGTSR
ncbi:MAG: gamma-glutamyl-gamma-aminobutyrate hydrolase family protein [Proteobacteria bacterium]|nr:gamma-glutamyl-gamma-aminobutyrate hydrolase family protein [Pseudomonadota bacterium]